ncbi:unnamed protein product [Somion occarium]|uniref:DUF6533 domain-containing protein n=1 Tax=Somion occarium TaxID=3059160 RepID=A0ABP1DTG4_9APHY
MDLGQLLRSGYQDVQTIRYAELASSTIIVLDHLITLDQEIELIWKSGWSVGKCLFLLNRYYTLAVVIFNNYSLHWFRWQGATGVIGFVVGELILQLRLYALYFLDKRILAFMALTFVCSVAAASTLMGISLVHVRALSHVLPGLPFCLPINVPSHFFSWWIPILVSETLLCGLALWRGFQSYYKRKNIFQSGRELIEILIRDSVLYFLVLFGIYLCNTIIFIIGNETQLEAAIGYSVAMSCVMGNRLCLNVRGMVHSDEDLPQYSGNNRASRGGHPVSRPTRHGSHRSNGAIQAVIDSSNASSVRLSEFEMHELRDMRFKL